MGNYLNYEKRFFRYLSKTFSSSSKIGLSPTFVPSKTNEKVNVYRTSIGDVWMIRILVSDDEIFYYFGGGGSKSKKGLFLKLILKINKDENKSFIKFLDDNNVALEIKIANENELTLKYLKEEFKLVKVKKENGKYLIILGKLDNSKIIFNLRKLLRGVIFDLNLNRDVLIVRGIKKYNKSFKSLKINVPYEISFSNVVKPVKSVKSNKNNSSKHVKANFDRDINKNLSKTNLKYDINQVDFKKEDIKNELFKNVCTAIKDGYKYIVLESFYEKSEIINLLSTQFKDVCVLTNNKQSKNRFIHNFDSIHFGKNIVHCYSDFLSKLKSDSNFAKKNIFILDDAHRLEKIFVDEFSYRFGLVNIYNDLNEVLSIDTELNRLKKTDSNEWLKFFKKINTEYETLIQSVNEKQKEYLYSNKEELEKVIEYIELNKNQFCSFSDNSYFFGVTFRPINISKFFQKIMLNYCDVCIFISSSILNPEKFIKEFGIDISEVKFIHENIMFNKEKTNIYAKNSINMNFKMNYKKIIPIINEILEIHKNNKGLIFTSNSDIKNVVMKNIKDERLISHGSSDFEKQMQIFQRGRKSIFVSESINEGYEFPDGQCRFQIILKQPLDPWDGRSRRKNELEKWWYDYRTAVNLVQIFKRAVTSSKDYCEIYMIDESLLRFLKDDVDNNNFIPDYMLNSVVDVNLSDKGFISENVKQKFGINYLHDYIPDKRSNNEFKKYDENSKKLSKKIQRYKNYSKINPNRYIEEFNFFNDELINALDELIINLVDENINKIALVAVPSATQERDKYATMRESIKFIVKSYTSDVESKFKSNKEIIDCSNLLYRYSDVKVSHNEDIRPSYGEHMESIKCIENELLEMNDVAFIILDDITTRGTILNACEDILVKNGVNRENIYKFSLFKTLW